MLSGLTNFLRKLFGGGQAPEPRFSLPVGIDKLQEEYSRTQELDGPGGPVTAREAYDLASEIILSFDPQARLTQLETVGRLVEDGKADGWLIVFWLPSCWGQALFRFKMGQSGDSLTVDLLPFVAAESALAKMMSEGQTGFVEQQWKVELERHPSLPLTFKDSSDVLTAWRRSVSTDQSLPAGSVLRALTPPLGKARWELLETSTSKKSLYTTPIE